MKGLACLFLGGVFLASCQTANISDTISKKELVVDDKMPYHLLANLKTDRGKEFRHPNGSGRILFFDVEGDDDYDLGAAYFKCNNSEEELVYAIYLRKKDTLYLDNKKNAMKKHSDGYIDEIVSPAGKRDPRKDAPDCG